ncbi:MAG: RNA polymerase-associated protein RapA [Verrucomicrobiota bacterium]
MREFIPGQRWLSEAEPELGLGMVLNAGTHQVTVVFRASGETRQYSIEHAPLKRVTFRVGETIRGGSGDQELKVSEVTEENGLFIYNTTDGEQVPETLLSDQLSFNTPRERLMAGHVDENNAFNLRYRALQLLHETRRSPVRGFIGGRIALIPHQLYIASEVTARQNARVLLADEVGLGKTIESCLILHRLLLAGRVSRALILVPESLVHQWFIELLRRFNLWFAIFDEERCAAIEQHDSASNPFQDDQLIIASLDLLAQKENRAVQAIAAGWDLLIVDEAHHLQWAPDAPSIQYRIVEELARKIPSVLLLTATPEQLGEASHFARLRLLDPERFHDLQAYLDEHASYTAIAEIGGKLLRQENLTDSDTALLSQTLKMTPTELAEVLAGTERAQLLTRLLDQHGTGRIMFRNTRAAMSGFPKRIAHLLELDGDKERVTELEEEFASDIDPHAPKPHYDYDPDPRIHWLAELLREDPSRKILLLCRYREKVEEIEAALRGHINCKAAVFHEKLPLIQRDRNAAWFAEEDGAQILICSEIGSEGRNFQFAHHLVLFDLPINPELLEQRIGRLDRIGQQEDIHIHVPFVKSTPQHLLARWYHEGVNAFEEHIVGGAEIFETFHDVLVRACEDIDTSKFNKLLKKTREFRAELEARLQSGRDRLLELHSFNPKRAEEIVAEISRIDQETNLDSFLLNTFDHLGIHIEELGQRTFNLGAGDLFKEKIPALPEEGATVTADRARALSREDIGFISWDHPITNALFDMILGSEQGNSVFALWPNAPAGGVLIETIYLLQTIAPPALHLDRFLPPTPIRIVLNHKRKEIEAEATTELLEKNLKNGSPALLASQMEELSSLLPGMIHVTEVIAGKRSKSLIQTALETARAALSAEIARLEQLQKINPSIRPDEIDVLRTQLQKSEEHLSTATVRLDSIRLILANAAITPQNPI